MFGQTELVYNSDLVSIFMVTSDVNIRSEVGQNKWQKQPDLIGIGLGGLWFVSQEWLIDSLIPNLPWIDFKGYLSVIRWRCTLFRHFASGLRGSNTGKRTTLHTRQHAVLVERRADKPRVAVHFHQLEDLRKIIILIMRLPLGTCSQNSYKAEVAMKPSFVMNNLIFWF